jgi:hypothetical protein
MNRSALETSANHRGIAAPTHREKHARKSENEIEQNAEHRGHGTDGDNECRAGQVKGPRRDHKGGDLGTSCSGQAVRSDGRNADRAHGDIKNG